MEVSTYTAPSIGRELQPGPPTDNQAAVVGAVAAVTGLAPCRRRLHLQRLRREVLQTAPMAVVPD